MHELINKRGHVVEELWKNLSPAFSHPQRMDFEREINRRVYSFIAVSALERGDVNIYGRDITELKHSCAACGDDSAFCCATKPGSGAFTKMQSVAFVGISHSVRHLRQASNRRKKRSVPGVSLVRW